MSLGRVRRPSRKANYGTTDKDVEKKRTRIYVICILVVIACVILDILFLKGIFSGSWKPWFYGLSHIEAAYLIAKSPPLVYTYTRNIINNIGRYGYEIES